MAWGAGRGTGQPLRRVRLGLLASQCHGYICNNKYRKVREGADQLDSGSVADD